MRAVRYVQIICRKTINPRSKPEYLVPPMNNTVIFESRKLSRTKTVALFESLLFIF